MGIFFLEKILSEFEFEKFLFMLTIAPFFMILFLFENFLKSKFIPIDRWLKSFNLTFPNDDDDDGYDDDNKWIRSRVRKKIFQFCQIDKFFSQRFSSFFPIQQINFSSIHIEAYCYCRISITNRLPKWKKNVNNRA